MLRYGGALKTPRPASDGAELSSANTGWEWEAPLVDGELPRLPAGEPIDHASALLKRALVQQTAAGKAIVQVVS